MLTTKIVFSTIMILDFMYDFFLLVSFNIIRFLMVEGLIIYGLMFSKYKYGEIIYTFFMSLLRLQVMSRFPHMPIFKRRLRYFKVMFNQTGIRDRALV